MRRRFVETLKVRDDGRCRSAAACFVGRAARRERGREGEERREMSRKRKLTAVEEKRGRER
jgi:hypothetical protein